MSDLALGEGAAAIGALAQLREDGALGTDDATYLLGLAHLAAFDWAGAMEYLRQFIAQHPTDDWRTAWAYLRLGQCYEELGREDEASLAYRGCLALPRREQLPRQLAFALMAQIAERATAP